MRLQPTARETFLGLVADLVRRPWQKLGARHFLDEYRANEWLAPSQLAELQAAKLRRLVWHCLLEVPAYAARIGETVKPVEIERLATTQKLPIVSRDARSDLTPFRAPSGEPWPGESAERRRALRLRADSWRSVRRLELDDVGLVGAACEHAPDGMVHLFADHFLVEPLADGTLCVTDLHEWERPILRWQLAARGRLEPRPCGCGRVLPLFTPLG